MNSNKVISYFLLVLLSIFCDFISIYPLIDSELNPRPSLGMSGLGEGLIALIALPILWPINYLLFKTITNIFHLYKPSKSYQLAISGFIMLIAWPPVWLPFVSVILKNKTY